ncbi:putative adenosine deaminase [Microstroma glucosiphilum]|uniref:Putative adenosine deaminase n=1 Tax=Pseudomicrostroma glucosiphilum TaxID=1684307 RepID=A0A316U582_9BASI|nr:putative adenosine deaminase [Pseudomicrostroma glucosiphilum]PWN19483.1 putative adenosine deaminase [Pseudomicrostroma glucosiphilum]
MVSLPYTSSDLSFTRSLAKVELHAHLNGSVRRSTLASLALAQGLSPDAIIASSQILPGDTRSTSAQFSVFHLAHKCIRGAEVVRRVTREILEDWSEDGVVYAEMRTTPRAHEEVGLSVEGYVQAVLDGFRDHQEGSASSSSSCHARLILSIDRRDGAEVAERTVNLALRHRSQGVIGIDLSGDPTLGQWSNWEPALRRARSEGLKVTIHAGEVPDADEETSQILSFHPDRLGHVCYLSPSNAKKLEETQPKIPLELCLTSNLLVCPQIVPEYSAHHFAKHYAQEHPVALCTDDTAVFGSSLSQEYAIAMQAFGFSREETKRIARDALQASFLDRNDPLWAELERVVGQEMTM